MEKTLAERADGGEGKVTTCGSCDRVHLRWDSVTVALGRERFLELARVLSTAAAAIAASEAAPAREAGERSAWTH